MTNYCEHVHNKFNKYTFGFSFCELLNVIICISQVTLWLWLFFCSHNFINFSDICHPCFSKWPVFWLWIQSLSVLQVSSIDFQHNVLSIILNIIMQFGFSNKVAERYLQPYVWSVSKCKFRDFEKYI